MKASVRKEMQALYDKAHAAGIAAFHGANPTPMVVGEGKGLFSNEIDHSKPTYFVADGVCGFAWINIRPARGSFVAFCKENAIGRPGYYGGYDVRLKGDAARSQSYERKMEYARAFATVLRDYGIEAYADGRLD